MSYRIWGTLAGLVIVATCSTAFGQFGNSAEPETKGVRSGTEHRQRYRVGMKVFAQGGPCAGMYGTVSVPTDWPDQEVRIVDEEVSENVSRIRYRMVEGGVKQMLVTIPRLAPNETAEALITFEITKKSLLAPTDPSVFRFPANVPRDFRKFMAASPLIESRNSVIRSQAKELFDESLGGWQQVEVLYDWVRDHIEHREGKVAGALAALRQQSGNHEDLTSLFIALCRANKIPARTVWIPDYCYAEFYLEDDDGNGHWIPCMVAGPREFGAMPDFRPVLQRGDSIKVPEQKEPQRFVAEFLKGKTGRGFGRPTVTFVRQILPAE